MKKLFLTLAAGIATAMLSTAVMADGMIKGGSKGGSLKDAPAPAPAARCASGPFAGTFIGGHVGYGWGRSDLHDDSGSPGFYSRELSTNEDGGFHGGVNFAHNWQCDRFVFGFASDFSFGDIDTHADYGGGDKISSTVSWYTTSRLRFGIAHDKTLFYATVGLAYADLEWKLNAGCCQAKNSENEFGWTVGGGIEFLRDHWSLRAEVLYVDLGETNIGYVVPATACGIYCSLNTKWDDSFLVARVALSFKLGSREEHTPLK